MARAGLMLLTVLVVFLAIWSSQEQLMARGVEDELVRPEIQVQKSKNGQGNLHSSQCPNACSRRCSQTQYRKPCMFYCQKCCSKCLCVPPGYYGNKQVCPCYNNWKTKRGGPKCPLMEFSEALCFYVLVYAFLSRSSLSVLDCLH